MLVLDENDGSYVRARERKCKILARGGQVGDFDTTPLMMPLTSGRRRRVRCAPARTAALPGATAPACPPSGEFLRRWQISLAHSASILAFTYGDGFESLGRLPAAGR